MPIYDFHCKSCTHNFEALCRDTHAEGLVCPSCKSDSLSRLISRFAVSQNLTPCGSKMSESACGYNPNAGCGRCAG